MPPELTFAKPASPNCPGFFANGPFDVVLLPGALNAIEHVQQWAPAVDFLRGTGGEIAALYPGLEPARAIHELVRRLITFY